MKISAVTNVIIITMLILLGIVANNYTYTTTTTMAMSPIYVGNTTTNKASLMINVYWGNEYISPMLKILKDNNIKTTFFIGGTWANKYPELLQEIVNNGHEIGNHGFFHKDSDKLSLQCVTQEIESNHKLIKALVGVDMNLFAPPSGAYNSTTMQACENLRYKAIMWTYDTIDWRDQVNSLIISRATKKIASGNLILMHPTKCTLDSLQQIIDKYKANNIQLTTVSQTIQ